MEVPLTRTEFDLLDLLTRSPRRTFSRVELLAAVWGNPTGERHVIEVHIAKLRMKIGESASRPRHIRTIRGVGYRFDPD
jgi:DNA-binding response OmpR family regulator